MTYATQLPQLSRVAKRLANHMATDVAKASGIHPNTIRAIRRGTAKNPGVMTLDRIAAALDSMEGVEHE